MSRSEKDILHCGFSFLYISSTIVPTEHIVDFSVIDKFFVCLFDVWLRNDQRKNNCEDDRQQKVHEVDHRDCSRWMRFNVSLSMWHDYIWGN